MAWEPAQRQCDRLFKQCETLIQIGVRRSDGQALGYAAAVPLILDDAGAVRCEPRTASPWNPVRTAPKALLRSVTGGLVSITAYAIVIWAMQLGAAGAVSALSETSVAFALLFRRLFLRETVGGVRWLSCVIFP